MKIGTYAKFFKNSPNNMEPCDKQGEWAPRNES